MPPPLRSRSVGPERVLRAIALVAGLALAHPAVAAPAFAAADDQRAIARVLSDYRTAVTSGKETLLTPDLLDEDISFFAVAKGAGLSASLTSAKTRDFAGFSRAVFHSGRRYTQSFDHIKIEQHLTLASVTLHFITWTLGGRTAWDGWKSLTMLKVGGRWKIASEFYTVGELR